MQQVLIQKNGRITIITISREKHLNALNKEVMDELNQALVCFEEAKDSSVLILTGSGERAFVAGADIAEMHALSMEEAQELSQLGQRIFSKIENMSKPVIAAVNGFALGGGCELAMACDIRLCSPNAKFGQPEVNLGVIPGYGGTQRLPLLVGKSRAMSLILTGDIIKAEEAERIGLVNQVITDGKLMEAAIELAEKIADKAPLAVKQAKKAINFAYNNSAGFDLEASLFGECFSTQDQREGMDAFLQKRKPNFTGS